MGKTPYTKSGLCKYNIGITCDQDESCDCSVCGWNPIVEKQRREQIEEKYDLSKIGARLEDIFYQFRSGRMTRDEAHDRFDEMKFALLGSRRTVPDTK